MPDLWKTLKDGVLKACDQVCRKKKEGRSGLWAKLNVIKSQILEKIKIKQNSMQNCKIGFIGNVVV